MFVWFVCFAAAAAAAVVDDFCSPWAIIAAWRFSFFWPRSGAAGMEAVHATDSVVTRLQLP